MLGLWCVWISSGVHREGLPVHLWGLPLSQRYLRSLHLQRGTHCWQALIETSWTSQIQSSEEQGGLLRPINLFFSPAVRGASQAWDGSREGLWTLTHCLKQGWKGGTEKNKSPTFVFSFPSPGFPLCEASWWDGSSASSEDASSSFLDEMVESSENLPVLGACGAWDKTKQWRFTWCLTGCQAHVHVTSHSKPRASLRRSLPAGERGRLTQENTWSWVGGQARTPQSPSPP